jgi:rare lipoprotein A
VVNIDRVGGRVNDARFRELYPRRIAYWFMQGRAGRVMYRSDFLIIAFVLSSASDCEAETGLASYYGGRGHAGEKTRSHRTRPFGSIVTVSYAGHSIRCRVNDRGPFVRGRVIDVSLSAVRALSILRSGVIRVVVE